jgi:hypothetical protein
LGRTSNRPVLGLEIPFFRNLLGAVAKYFGLGSALASGAWYEIVQFMGEAGEKIVADATGLTKNTAALTMRDGTSVIPDFIDRANGLIIEAKNVSSLSLTQQLYDMMDYARMNQQTFQIWVREGADLSPQIRAAWGAGLLQIKTFVWP